MTPHCARRNASWRALRPPSMRILQCSVATSALFPALPLPSVVKLNTGLKLAETLHLTQAETEKSVLKRVIVTVDEIDPRSFCFARHESESALLSHLLRRCLFIIIAADTAV